jgi:hypothetical protein
MMADGFKVGNGLKQGDGFASSLFNTALQYVIRELSVEDKNITERTKGAASEVNGELTERAQEVRLNMRERGGGRETKTNKQNKL